MGPAGGNLGRDVLVRADEGARAGTHRLRHEPCGSGRRRRQPTSEGEAGGLDAEVADEGLKGGGDGGFVREVEVGKHDVAVAANEDVLGLEVAVDDSEHVEVFERQQHLRRIEPADITKQRDAVLISNGR